MNATEVITDAYQRCNRLSPGEALSGDDLAVGLARLNILVDELSADGNFLFKETLTTATQSGHITLGAGSWAAIPPGSEIQSMLSNGVPMAELTMQQYAQIYDPAVTGTPTHYAQDGLSTVYLYPVATGQSIRILTRGFVAEFADGTTEYTVPPGYASALGAILAAQLAPMIGGASPEVAKAERLARNRLFTPKPAIVDVTGYGRSYVGGNILNGGF